MNPSLSKYCFYYPATLLRGERIFHYLSEYRERQWLADSDLLNYQLEHLKRLVCHAYDHVPYYRRVMNQAGIIPADISTITALNLLPTLSKRQIIKDPSSLLARPRKWFTSKKTTGGSTGQAVSILKDSNALARERAATWRAYEWAQIHIGDRQARFWGVPITHFSRLSALLTDSIANRTRFSAFNFERDQLSGYWHRLQRMQPAYFYGYVSMLSELADYVLEHKPGAIESLRSVITTSEVLDEPTRIRLEHAFRVPVFNEYGCGEVGSIAHECASGNMHLMADNLLVEVDADDTSTESSGELIITDLHNYAMPLIRYRIGDFAQLSSYKCPCRRTLPILAQIHGRAYDFILDPDGKMHHPEVAMYVFEELRAQGLPFERFQVIQQSESLLLIRLVVDDTRTKKNLEERICTRFREVIHPGFSLAFEYTTNIPREPSGKLRVIKSMLAGST